MFSKKLSDLILIMSVFVFSRGLKAQVIDDDLFFLRITKKTLPVIATILYSIILLIH